MGLITLLAQLLSILRAELWKVVKKCKNNMFFNFRVLFLKMYFFEVKFFLPYCTSNQLNLPVVVHIYKILVFDETFFLLATIAMTNEKMSFSCFSCNCCYRNNLFHCNHAAYQFKLSLKKWNQIDKTTQKKIVSMVYLFFSILYFTSIQISYL